MERFVSSLNGNIPSANGNMNHAMNGNGVSLQPPGTMAASPSATVQNLLMENGRLIETIAGLQRIQKHADVPKYMELLYRNIVHLAKLGDPEALSQLQLESGLVGAAGLTPASAAQPHTMAAVQPAPPTVTAANYNHQPVNGQPMQTAQRAGGGQPNAPSYGMAPTSTAATASVHQVPQPQTMPATASSGQPMMMAANGVPMLPPHSMPAGQQQQHYAPQPLHPMHHPYGVPPVGLPAPGQPPHHLPPPHGDPAAAAAAAAMYHHQQQHAQAQHPQMASHPYGMPPQVQIYTSVANAPDQSST